MTYDQATADYFNRETPHYDIGTNFAETLEFLRAAPPESELLDVGCGDGTTIEFLKEATPIDNFFGMDIASNFLEEARSRTGCSTIQGSILDEAKVAEYADRFDYVVLRAVLHHLVGRTRRSSLEFSQRCIENTLRVLKPGGHLIIAEPTYSPRMVNFAAFWIKQLVGSFTSNRMQLKAPWLNIAQPVVSYYTAKEVMSQVRRCPKAEVSSSRTVEFDKLAGFIRPSLTLMIVTRA